MRPGGTVRGARCPRFDFLIFSTPAGMLPQLRTRWDQYCQQRDRLLDELGALSEAQLAFRPAPGAWSLNEVAHHLLLVEQGVAASFARPPKPEPRTVRHLVGRVLVRLLLGSPLRVRVPTRRVLPTGEITLPEIRTRWSGVSRELEGQLSEITPATLGRPAMKHPYSGPLDARRTLNFLGRHFRHHLRQVARVRRAPAFPA